MTSGSQREAYGSSMVVVRDLVDQCSLSRVCGRWVSGWGAPWQFTGCTQWWVEWLHGAINEWFTSMNAGAPVVGQVR